MWMSLDSTVAHCINFIDFCFVVLFHVSVVLFLCYYSVLVVCFV